MCQNKYLHTKRLVCYNHTAESGVTLVFKLCGLLRVLFLGHEKGKCYNILVSANSFGKG